MTGPDELGRLADELARESASPDRWRLGLHALHCREDRCGPNGERCDCPCHRGEVFPDPVVSYDTGDQRLDEIFARLDDHDRRIAALVEAGKSTAEAIKAMMRLVELMQR